MVKVFSITNEQTVKNYMREIVYLVVVMMPMMVFITALGAEGENLGKIPVSISIKRLHDENIVLEVFNPTKKEQKLTSNLPRVLDYLCFDFPAVGALQLRDVKTKQVFAEPQLTGGWYYPVSASSILNSKKSQEISVMGDIYVPAKGLLQFPLKWDKAFKCAVGFGLKKGDEALEIRFKLPLLVTTVSGDIINVKIISDWFPVPADFK